MQLINQRVARVNSGKQKSLNQSQDMSRPPSAGLKKSTAKPKPKLNAMISLTGGTDDRKVEISNQNVSMP